MKKTILVLLSTFIYVGASCQDKDFYKKTNHYFYEVMTPVKTLDN